MEKREQIIKASMELFVEFGFEHSPSSKIAKKASVGEGTIFRYFKTKNELINETYVYVKNSMANYIFQNLTGKEDTKEAVKIVWKDLLKWGFEKKIEAQFLERFYGSTYINNLSFEQARIPFKPGLNVFLNAKEESLIKNISLELFRDLTFGMFHCFRKEILRKGKLDEDFLEQSFEMYWGTIKK